MGIRAPADTAASLRVLVENFEERADGSEDVEARDELKRILLLRIAELETGHAKPSGDGEGVPSTVIPAAPTIAVVSEVKSTDPPAPVTSTAVAA
jgi:hypothetical protein